MRGEIKNINKFVYTLLLLFFSQLSFAQEITIDKKIIENNANCQQFDVELKIIGNPTIKPQEVVLLIDNSGSMAGQVTTGGVTKTLLEHAQEAAVDFVNNIFAPTNDPLQKNKVAIISYNSFANTEITLTDFSGKQNIINQINSIVSGGSTNMEDALIKADEVLSPPGNQGTFDCATTRNIILLTDGVPRWHNGLGTNVTGNGQCSATTIDTDCQTRAFTAATNAATTTISGETFNQQIFTVGFTGTLSPSELAVAQHSLNNIQNSGAFYTNDAADLTGIYNTIFGQLLAAATAIPGESLVNDVIPNGFEIVPGSLVASKGNFTIDTKEIDWFIDRIVNETVTLNYSIVANTDQCGVTDPGTSTIKYQNSNCTVINQEFENPQVCVPCPEATISLVKNSAGCKSVDFSSTINQLSCDVTSEVFSWKFYLNGIEVGTSTLASGTFEYTGSDVYFGELTAKLEYSGFYESNCPAQKITNEAKLNINCTSDLSIKISVSNSIPTVGETIIYNIVIKNDGPENVSNVDIINALPTGLTYTSIGSSIPAGTIFNSSTGIWSLNNTIITAGNVLELKLAVVVNGAGTFESIARVVQSGEGDSDSTPNNGS